MGAAADDRLTRRNNLATSQSSTSKLEYEDIECRGCGLHEVARQGNKLICQACGEDNTD